MPKRLLVPVVPASVLLAGLVSLGTPAAHASSGPAGSSAADAVAASRAAAPSGTCLRTALSKRRKIKARSGAVLGTVQAFGARDGEDLGFCVRVLPAPRLRRTTTFVSLTWEDFDAAGNRSSSGGLGGSGYWRTPFLLTGNIYETGSRLEGVLELKAPGGPRGTAKVRATLS